MNLRLTHPQECAITAFVDLMRRRDHLDDRVPATWDGEYSNAGGKKIDLRILNALKQYGLIDFVEIMQPGGRIAHPGSVTVTQKGLDWYTGATGRAIGRYDVWIEDRSSAAGPSEHRLWEKGLEPLSALGLARGLTRSYRNAVRESGATEKLTWTGWYAR